MYRKILATAVTMFLLMTSLAYAANMQVNSSATPVSGGTVTPNGIKFFGPLSTDAQRTYAVAPKAGWTLTKVQIDGVDALAPYVVPFDTSKIHTVKASFAQTLSTFTLTATAGAGGTAIITGGGATGIKATDNRHVVVGPSTGNQIDTLVVDGVAQGAAVGSKIAITVDFAPFGASNHTVAATFIKTPVAINVSVGGNRTIGGTPAFSTTLSGSASVAPTTIQWNLVSGPAGSSFGTPNALSTTFTGTTLGPYVVSLTVNGTTSPSATITVSDSVNLTCATCHADGGTVATAGPVFNLKNSVSHSTVLCNQCHVGTHPAAPTCNGCHGASHPNNAAACNQCHVPGDVVNGDAHGASSGSDCLSCHNVATNVIAGAINDNGGVRAIIPEFNKRSHHITGGAPKNEQCAVCHLEGQLGTDGKVHTTSYHLNADGKIHLRNADTDADFAWSGTEHTNMDNFCFSCHDSNGATSAGIAAIMTGKNFGGPFSATNPFADTLTNSYDLVARPGVVDVKTAFTTTNASHHAVSGQRYKYRFSTEANAAAWAARTGNPMPAASEIAVGNLDLDGNPIEFVEGEDSYDPHGAEEGGHATLYEGDKFVATYIPLGATKNVADNSTLHCGDCHTVGQWKVGSSTNADGTATPVAIGAHGSANEYLLRNSLGTDALHNGLTYVCFNCHATGTQAATAEAWAEQVAESLIADSVAPVSGGPLNPKGLYIPTPVPSWKAGWNALHPTVYAGQLNGYATAHAVSAFHAQCQADSTDNLTSVPDRGFNNFSSNRLQRSWAPQSVKVYDYAPASGATAAAPAGGSNAASGNITGIACTNCHNSGLRSSWGGIHGGDNTYTDGLGRTQKSYRFMPGMGNYRYAPPGGWDGKDVSDPTLLTINNPLYPGTPGSRTDQAVGFPGASGKPMGGCYTNGGTGGAGSDLNNSGGVTYGVCNHHGTSTAASAAAAGRPATFRATYGGGTTGNPTTYEPTVREATSGGTLVTRPLKY